MLCAEDFFRCFSQVANSQKACPRPLTKYSQVVDARCVTRPSMERCGSAADHSHKCCRQLFVDLLDITLPVHVRFGECYSKACYGSSLPCGAVGPCSAVSV